VRGRFTNLKDFITRVADLDVNKRAIENFIKAGALDSLGGTRKQCMSVYVQILDHITKDKKNNLAGQLSLFDIASEDQKEEFDIKMPEVGEYPKEMMLGFEKEVLGIYVSGHPLEEYQELWERTISNRTTDFMLDEESDTVVAEDGRTTIIGGLIADKNVKYTKNDQIMAFLNIEDLVGNVEVIVFPRDYERYANLLTEDAKVFIKGRIAVEEEKDGKVICEQIATFEDALQGKPLFTDRFGRQGSYNSRSSYGRSNYDKSNGAGGNRGTGNQSKQMSTLPEGVWIQFANKDVFKEMEQKLYDTIADSDGAAQVVVYIKEPKSIKILPPNLNVCANEELINSLNVVFGTENVKIITKPIENK